MKELPAVYHHCVTVWKEMDSTAADDDEGQRVYTGHLTKLFRKVGLSVPYYTNVMNHLKRMDCVRQLYRGGGGTPSRWVLLQEPTTILFESSPGFKSITKQDDILAQMIRNQQDQINRFDERLLILEAKVG